jgi:general secretion pathway protein D
MTRRLRLGFAKQIRSAGLWTACVIACPVAMAQTPPTVRGGSNNGMVLPAPASSAATPAARPSQGQPGMAANAAPGTSDARLQVYDIPLEHVGSAVAMLQSQFGADRRVRITTEPNSGRLMVLAPDATQRQLALSVEEIKKHTGSLQTDAQGRILPSSTQTRQYKLQVVTWRELEDAISRIAGSRLTISTLNNGEIAQLQMLTETGPREVMTIDRRNDEVRLQGSPQDVMAWTTVVTAIDLAQVDPQRPTQIIPINPATPERIERAIHLVKHASYQQPPQDEATGTAQFNPQQNLDNSPGAAIGTPDGLSSGTGLIGDVDISFVPEMGLVIVKGGKRDVQRVLEVIEQIKKQSQETQPDIEIYPLKHVNGVVLEPILKDLNDKVFSPRQGQISLYALGQPNSLLLIGRPEALTGIKELITKLDQPIDLNNQLKVFRLVNSSAIDAETIIRNFFGDTATGAGGNNANSATATQLATRVKVVADYRTNSLIVQASPRDIAEVARLILEIDVESTPAENEFRVFQIKNAVASELQPILQSAINGSSTGGSTGQGGQQQQQSSSSASGRSTPPSSGLSIVNPEGDKVSSGILAGVVVTSNPSINALLVRAPSKSMPLIAALIEQLDQIPNAEARIKVYPVINGDATSLALTLQQVFGLPATAGASTTNAATIGLQNLAALTGGGESSLVQLRISVDTRTNSIIASGAASDLEVIEALLYRLDESGGQQRVNEVVWLRNANAIDVFTALNSLLNSQRQVINQQLATGQAISLFERVDREVFVVSEPVTNSLVISATPRYMSQIREVIERLDRQQPMIHVEMLIAEVVLGDKFELGTEFGLQDSLLFDRNVSTGGTLTSPVFDVANPPTTGPFRLGSPQARSANVAGQGSSGFAMGRVSELGYGGLVLAASSESVGMLFRMLQDVNRAQILARPNLTTIDNNISVVRVGQRIPIIDQVAATVGVVTQGITYVDAGLTMQIQPRTNQDGLIKITVGVNRLTVDRVNGITINGSESPAFNQTEAQTTVTAYDGQTVILAGLISKERTTVSKRIPWLADIPIAGALFRFDKEAEQRTELLVVMTPRVINYNDPDKLEMIKQIESSRMSWCMADVINIHGDKGLSPGNGLWGPAASPVIYPDETPTVDASCEPTMASDPSMIVHPGHPGAPQTEMFQGQPMDGSIIIDDPSQRMNMPMNMPMNAPMNMPMNMPMNAPMNMPMNAPMNMPMNAPMNSSSSSRTQPRTLLQMEGNPSVSVAPGQPGGPSGVATGQNVPSQTLVQPARPGSEAYYAPANPNAGRIDRPNYQSVPTNSSASTIGNGSQVLTLPK